MAIRKVEVIADKAPKTVGPYPQGIKVDDFVFTSLILPLNAEGTAIIGKDVGNQTKQCIKNLSLILDPVCAVLTQVCKLNVYLANISDIPVVDAILKDELIASPPARTVIGGVQLPYKVLIAIDAVVRITQATTQGAGVI